MVAAVDIVNHEVAVQPSNNITLLSSNNNSNAARAAVNLQVHIDHVLTITIVLQSAGEIIECPNSDYMMISNMHVLYCEVIAGCVVY